MTNLRIMYSEVFSVNHLKKSNFATTMAIIDETIFIGCLDGRIFMQKEKEEYEEIELKMSQKVNLLFRDEFTHSLFVGDGSCCSGSTFQILPDGHSNDILPYEGQNDCPSGRNLKGNVYAMTRHEEELLCGTGGCAGRHIYRKLDEKDKQKFFWEFHPNDPELYVQAMLTTSWGETYIAMGGQWKDAGVFIYDGKNFKKIYNEPGGVHQFVEFKGNVFYVANWHPAVWRSGDCVCLIHQIDKDGRVKRLFQKKTRLKGFFTFEGSLFAYGAEGTPIFKMEEDGNWQDTGM